MPKVTVVRKLSEDEVNERAKTLCDLLRKIDDLEAEKKSFVNHVKTEIKDIDDRVDKLRYAISNQQEEQEFDCEVEKNFDDFTLRYIDTITGEVVKIETMSMKDRQLAIVTEDTVQLEDVSVAGAEESTVLSSTEEVNL